MPPRFPVFVLASAFSLVALGARAQPSGDGRVALGLGVGTNGGIIEGAVALSPAIVLRAQGAFIDFNAGFNSGDIHYGGRLHFNTGGGFADIHPARNPWFLTGGAVVGERKVDVNARPTVAGSFTIHGVTYPVTEVAQVNGTIDYGNARPFAGLGWDNTFYTAHKIGVRFLAGVVFGADPAVHLAATGPYANDPTVLTNLREEESSLRSQAGDYRYYPVVQLGLNYRF